MLCHQHTQGSFIMLQRGPRPLSNPHYIWANVGNEDVWVIKHHCGPSLYKKRNTLSGIVLHLKDKYIGQKISPILVTVPYYAPCSTVSRQFIFSPLDGSLGVLHVSASLMCSNCCFFVCLFFNFVPLVPFTGECWPNERQRTYICQFIKLHLGAELINTIYL